jgi:hypothetical protein
MEQGLKDKPIQGELVAVGIDEEAGPNFGGLRPPPYQCSILSILG